MGNQFLHIFLELYICIFAVVNEKDGNQMERYLHDSNYMFTMVDDVPFTN